jgi:hypothetical protein
VRLSFGGKAQLAWYQRRHHNNDVFDVTHRAQYGLDLLSRDSGDNCSDIVFSKI